MSMSQTAPSSDTERWLFEEEAKASKVKVQDPFFGEHDVMYYAMTYDMI